jgi:glycosyltransferase involved in cell wall biosynthesis
MACTDPRVAILLATFNGAAWLQAQLDSFLEQTHNNWLLYWRDDGSADDTVAIVKEFSARAGQGRCVQVVLPVGHLGATGNFLALLRAVSADLAESDLVAFADQDDVWLPTKLARGVAALMALPAAEPVLYCARQILVDANLRQIGRSGKLTRPPAFPAALTQNVVTGCTMMLNRAGAQLLAASQPPSVALHDWWAYLLVTASGGRLLQDAEPVILYRQHAGNLVGAPPSRWRRALDALRRGPGLYMTVLRQHVAALLAQPQVLTARAHAELLWLDGALRNRPWRRLGALAMPGLRRQTWAETLLFRWWFLVG